MNPETTNDAAVAVVAPAENAVAEKPSRKLSRMAAAMVPVRAALGKAQEIHAMNRKTFAAIAALDVAVSRGKPAAKLSDRLTDLLRPELPENVRAVIRSGISAAAKGDVPSRECRETIKALSIVLDTAYRAEHDSARMESDKRRAIAEDIAAKKKENAAKVSRAELENENALLRERLAALEAKIAAA